MRGDPALNITRSRALKQSVREQAKKRRESSDEFDDFDDDFSDDETAEDDDEQTAAVMNRPKNNTDDIADVVPARSSSSTGQRDGRRTFGLKIMTHAKEMFGRRRVSAPVVPQINKPKVCCKRCLSTIL